MKIVIASDLQIGAGRDLGTTDHPRLHDQAEALDAIAALSREADLLLILGDLFQTRHPTVDEILVMRNFLAGVDARYGWRLLAGNHDVLGPRRATTLSLFDNYDGTVFVGPGVELVGSTAVGYLPWAHPGPLRAEGIREPHEQAARIAEVAAGLAATIAASEYPNGPSLLVTHYALSGMSIPSGLVDSRLVGEPVLPTADLLGQGWRWVVAGHIHQPGYRRDDLTHGEAFHVGSPYVCDWGEADHPHGVLMLDTETGDHVVHSIPDRHFSTMAYNAEAWQEIVSGREAIMVEGAVVRARVHASPAEARTIDPARIRDALYIAGAHNVTSVEVVTREEGRARVEIREDAGVLEALDTYLEAVPPDPPEDAERLRTLTASLLREEG